MQVLCVEERLSQQPLESQMDLVTMKLENRCWRSVPAILKLDAIGVPVDAEENQTARRFAVIQNHIDRMFNQRQDPRSEVERQAKLLAGSIQIVVDSLPRIFTKYEDFWPTNEFIRSLLHFATLQTFTENASILAVVRNYTFATKFDLNF
jgi:hypothetical protein